MNKNDLRYRKTEANLKHAYLSLLRQADCRSITVRKLCTLAQCARNTFYQHYPDLKALEHAIVGELLNDISGAFRPVGNPIAPIPAHTQQQYVANIIAGVTAQQATLRVLLAKDDGSFQKQLADVIAATILNQTKSFSTLADTAINRLNTAYLASAIAGFIASWLSQPDVDATLAQATLLTIHQATIQTSARYLAG